MEERDPLCMGCGQRVPRQFDNIGLVRTVLSRSGNMPLRVDITLAGDATFDPIARVLDHVSYRIAYLHLSADNSATAVEFLDEFEVLNQLQQLVVVTEVEQDEDVQEELPRALFTYPMIPLKALRHLEVEGPYYLPPGLASPALEYARLPIHDMEDFGRGLEVCNNIRYLHYEIGDDELDEEVDSELKRNLRSTLIRIAPEVLVVSDIFESDAAVIMDVVHIPELRNLTLAFRQDSTVYIESFDIFADIETSWSLDWALSGDQRTVSGLSATGATGLTRKIVWEAEQLDMTDESDPWDRLPSFEMLDRIEVDAINWNESYHTIPDMPQLHDLSLRFVDPSEIYPALSRLGLRLSRWSQLEQVRLRFIGDEYRNSSLREFVNEVVRVADDLRIPANFTKVKKLEVSGLDLVDNASPLSRIAERVVLAP